MNKLKFILALLISIYMTQSLSSQFIEYKEMTPIPDFEINKVRDFGEQGIYVQGYSEIVHSINDGQTWEKVCDIPKGAYIHDFFVNELGDFYLIMRGFQMNNVYKIVNEEYIPLIPRNDTLSFNVNAVAYDDNKILFSVIDYYYKFSDNENTVDLGSDRGTRGEPLFTAITDERFLIYKLVGQFPFSYVIDMYDFDFNYINTFEVENQLPNSAKVLSKGPLILIESPYDDQILFTYDNGITWQAREGHVYFELADIDHENIYLTRSDSLFSLPILGDLVNDEPVFHSVIGTAKGFNINDNRVVKFTDDQIYQRSIEDLGFQELDAINRSDSSVEKIEINHKGEVFVMNKHHVFRSQDAGNSWYKIFGNGIRHLGHFSFGQNGDLLIAEDNSSFYRINSVDEVSHVVIDSMSDSWVDYSVPYIFEREINNELKYLGFGCNPNTFSPGYAFIYNDENLEYADVILNAHIPLTGDLNLNVVDDSLFLTTHNLSLIHMSANISDFEFKTNRFPLSVTNRLNYVGYVDSKGGLYVHPIEQFLTPELFFTSYYAPSLVEELRPVGRGFPGRIITHEDIDGTILLRNDGGHFLRRALDENFDTLNTSMPDFETLIDFTFSPDSKMYLVTDNGRILKSNSWVKPTSTSSESISQIKVYPNPAINEINLINADDKNFKIYDSMGKLMLLGKAQSTSTSIDLKGWTNGIYYLNAYSDNKEIETIKILKF